MTLVMNAFCVSKLYFIVEVSYSPLGSLNMGLPTMSPTESGRPVAKIWLLSMSMCISSAVSSIV